MTKRMQLLGQEKSFEQERTCLQPTILRTKYYHDYCHYYCHYYYDYYYYYYYCHYYYDYYYYCHYCCCCCWVLIGSLENNFISLVRNGKNGKVLQFFQISYEVQHK